MKCSYLYYPTSTDANRPDQIHTSSTPPPLPTEGRWKSLQLQLDDGRWGGRGGGFSECWVSERGCRECGQRTDRQTTKDQHCPKVQNGPFNQASPDVHTVRQQPHGPTESLFNHSYNWIFTHLVDLLSNYQLFDLSCPQINSLKLLFLTNQQCKAQKLVF